MLKELRAIYLLSILLAFKSSLERHFNNLIDNFDLSIVRHKRLWNTKLVNDELDQVLDIHLRDLN